MKRLLIAIFSFLILILWIEGYENRLKEIKKQSIEASIVSIPEAPVLKKPSPKTETLLNLLETVIDQDRNYLEGEKILQETEKNEENQQLLELYEAKILSRSLDFEKARRFLESVNRDDLIILKAAVLIALNDRDAAGAYLHGVVESEASSKDAKIMALNLLSIYEQYDFHRDADISYLWTLFAQRFGDLEEFEISQYLVKKALERRPEYRDAWIIKGYDELSLKKYAEAEISLLTAYQLDPGNANIQYLLGITYFELDKPDLSTQYLLYAKENAKEYLPIIYEKLGENAIKTKEYPIATYYFETLLKIDPNHPLAVQRLLWLKTLTP